METIECDWCGAHLPGEPIEINLEGENLCSGCFELMLLECLTDLTHFLLEEQ